MHDAIAAVEVAPLWAKIVMAIFVAIAVFMVAGPSFRHRRFRRQFDALARALGQAPPTGGGWPAAFATSIDGRMFEIRHDLRVRGSSYRGPTGYLLVTATRLAGTRWDMHQVDVTRLDGLLARIVRGTRLTGDPDFDARFAVVEDGLPARDGWLDAATREAIARFFDESPRQGLLWIREGELQFIMQDPWTGVDGPFIRALLQRQAALSSALERTARHTA